MNDVPVLYYDEVNRLECQYHLVRRILVSCSDLPIDIDLLVDGGLVDELTLLLSV